MEKGPKSHAHQDALKGAICPLVCWMVRNNSKLQASLAFLLQMNLLNM